MGCLIADIPAADAAQQDDPQIPMRQRPWSEPVTPTSEPVTNQLNPSHPM